MVTENSTYIEFNDRREAVTVSVNDRAATRQIIIEEVRQSDFQMTEGSSWGKEHYNSSEIELDWNYTKIAIHHSGRSYTCGPAASQLQKIQQEHMHAKVRRPWGDIGYHYAADCAGNIFECRDIRFKGSGIKYQNTGVISIVLLENLTDTGDTLLSFFATKLDSVPEPQKKAVQTLVNVLTKHFHISTLGGHREYAAKLAAQNDSESRTCPGNVGMKFVYGLRSNLKIDAP